MWSVTSVTTHRNWFERASNGAVGAAVGIALFVGSFVLLGWNEARSVAEIRAINECAALVVDVDCTPSADNDGHLVHISCALTDIPTWRDEYFDVTVTAPALSRIVEMAQYEESSSQSCHKDKIGGGQTCVTTYSYSVGWDAHRVDSTLFHDLAYRNPPASAWVVAAQTQAPAALHAGGFGLPPAMIAQLAACATADCSAPVPPPAGGGPLPVCDRWARTQQPCPWSLSPGAPGGGSYYYYTSGYDRSDRVGDLRVALRASSATSVSVLAVQQGAGAGAPTFAPYTARSGHTCFMLDAGDASAATMTHEAAARNAAATWTLRLVGLLMMWVGLVLVVTPLSLVADLVPFVGPFVGDLMSIGAKVATAPIAASLTLLTVAFSWIAVRPALGVLLLLLGAGFAGGVVYMQRRKRAERSGGASLAASDTVMGYPVPAQPYAQL